MQFTDRSRFGKPLSVLTLVLSTTLACQLLGSSDNLELEDEIITSVASTVTQIALLELRETEAFVASGELPSSETSATEAAKTAESGAASTPEPNVGAAPSAPPIAGANPADTSTNQATTVSTSYADSLEDCQLFDDQRTDCFGIDIEGVMLAVIRNDDDLAHFYDEASAAGFVNPGTQITAPKPFIIGSIKIHDFDSGEGYFCLNWADPATITPPSDPGKNVLSSCSWPVNDFVYTNSIGADGRQFREIDPAGTSAYTDFRTGVTLVQELNRIYSEELSKPVEVLSFDNMQARFDIVVLDSLAAVLD